MNTKNCRIRSQYPRTYIGDIIDYPNPWFGIFPPHPWYGEPGYSPGYSGNTTTFADALKEITKSKYSLTHRVINDEKSFSVEFSCPGFNKEDIEIMLQNNVLTVEVRKEEEGETEGTKYFFAKEGKESFVLPKECDLSTITSKYENGILSVSVEKIEKVPEKPEIKRIEIN